VKDVAFTIKTMEFTSDIFAQLLREYNQNKEKFAHGKISYNKLIQQSRGELQAQKISDKNIADFTEVARKYDLTFALKANKATVPHNQVKPMSAKLQTVKTATEIQELFLTGFKRKEKNL
jgi:uncharacterized protein YeaO (DUF488 family)